MLQEEHGRHKGQIAKAEGEGEKVDVEKGEVQEEHLCHTTAVVGEAMGEVKIRAGSKGEEKRGR